MSFTPTPPALEPPHFPVTSLPPPFASRYALSSACAEFGTQCDHGEHSMVTDKCNERFYLVNDLRAVIEVQRVKLDEVVRAAGAAEAARQEPPPPSPAAASMETEATRAEDQLAYLDEQLEELAKIETNLDLYVRHLLRKAQSSAISSKILDGLKV